MTEQDARVKWARFTVGRLIRREFLAELATMDGVSWVEYKGWLDSEFVVYDLRWHQHCRLMRIFLG